MKKLVIILVLILSSKLYAQSDCNKYCIYSNKEIDTITVELNCFDIVNCKYNRDTYFIQAAENSKYIIVIFKISNLNLDSIDLANIKSGSSIVVPITRDYIKGENTEFKPAINIGTYILRDILLDKLNRNETQISKSAGVTILYKKVGSDEVKGYTIPIVVEYTKRL